MSELRELLENAAGGPARFDVDAVRQRVARRRRARRSATGLVVLLAVVVVGAGAWQVFDDGDEGVSSVAVDVRGTEASGEPGDESVRYLVSDDPGLDGELFDIWEQLYTDEVFPRVTPARVTTLWYGRETDAGRRVTGSVNVIQLPSNMRDLDLFAVPGSTISEVEGRTVAFERSGESTSATWIHDDVLVVVAGGFDQTELPAIVASFRQVSTDEWSALRASLSDRIAALPIVDEFDGEFNGDTIVIRAHGTDTATPEGYCLESAPDQACTPTYAPELIGSDRYLFEANVLLDGAWWYFGHHGAGLTALTYTPAEAAATLESPDATYFATRMSGDDDFVERTWRATGTDAGTGASGTSVLARPLAPADASSTP